MAGSIILKLSAIPKLPKKNIIVAIKKSPFRVVSNGGGGGIRTHGTLARSTVFKTAPINRSGTPPKLCCFV